MPKKNCTKKKKVISVYGVLISRLKIAFQNSYIKSLSYVKCGMTCLYILLSILTITLLPIDILFTFGEQKHVKNKPNKYTNIS